MKKKLTAALLAALMTLSLTVTASAAFVDVPSNQWYYDDVTAVEKYGIIQGVGDGRFNPDGTLTLAEAITMACRARAIQMGGNAERIPEWYTSVTGEAPGSWFQPYVLYADTTGICPLGEYGSNYDAPCSRLVMAKLFSMVVYRDDGSIDNNVSALPDTDDLDVLYLYNLGILTGSDKYGTFHPNDSIKRCEAATIINRVMDPSARVQLDFASQSVVMFHFLNATVGQVAAQYGWEFQMYDGWWYGGSKAIVHPDLPALTLLVSDPSYRISSPSDLTGSERITMVQADADPSVKVLPALDSYLTLAQLRAYLPGGSFVTGDQFFSDDGAEAQYSLRYDSDLYITYQWYQSDPYTQPADWVTITG